MIESLFNKFAGYSSYSKVLVNEHMFKKLYDMVEFFYYRNPSFWCNNLSQETWSDFCKKDTFLLCVVLFYVEGVLWIKKNI